MVFLLLFALAYGVIQTLAVSTPARSISWRLVCLAFFTGLSGSAGLALLVQRVDAVFLASVLHIRPDVILRSGSYLQDPVIEEIAKVLPLAVLAVFPRIRKALGCADMVVLAAALGAGFGFTENLLSVAAETGDAHWRDGFWRVNPEVNGVAVPGPLTTLRAWLPGGYSLTGLFIGPPTVGFNVHLAWSALVGLGVALAFKPGKIRWLAPALLTFASLDHMTFNALLSNVAFPLGLTSLFAWVRKINGLYMVAALAVAIIFDRVALPAPLKEPFALPPIPWRGGLRAIAGFWRSILTRRTLTLGIAAGLYSREEALAEFDRQVRQLPSRAPLPGRLVTVVGVILAGPPLLFFATCGAPHFDWLRQAMASTPVFLVLRSILTVSTAILGVATITGTFAFLRDAASSDGNGRLLLNRGFTLFSTMGAVVMGMLALLDSVGKSPLARMGLSHILEHWAQSIPLVAAMIAQAIAAFALLWARVENRLGWRPNARGDLPPGATGRVPPRRGSTDSPGPSGHVLEDYESFDGDSSFTNAKGNHECVTFAQQAGGAPLTKYWRPGIQVTPDADIAPGTWVATFVNGRYEGHVGVFVSMDASGNMMLLDQWNDKGKVEKTFYSAKPAGYSGKISRDPSKYFVVEW